MPGPNIPAGMRTTQGTISRKRNSSLTLRLIKRRLLDDRNQGDAALCRGCTCDNASPTIQLSKGAYVLTKFQPTRSGSAEATIRQVLLSVLPPGATPSFRKIVSARFVGQRKVVAELEMVDGLPASVEAWQWRPDGWAHRWLRFDGGDLFWENGRWQRAAAIDVPAEP